MPGDRGTSIASVEPLTERLWPALADLFGRSGASNGCWCQYWILGPDYHRRPRELNRIALQRAASADPPAGLVALDPEGAALGWCRLGPRTDLDWLNRRRDLAPVDDLPVWSLPCFFVRRDARGHGVMNALITGAIIHATDAGAPALEAYPIDTAVPGSTRNVFTGTASAFASAGFTELARRSPARPIMRLTLGPGMSRHGQAWTPDL